MTKEQLIEVMLYYLNNLNDKGSQPIDANTVINTVLSSSDGFGTATSKNIFKALVRWSLKRGGHVDKPWPDNWFNLTVDELATKIL